jgi:hypothetical protein
MTVTAAELRAEAVQLRRRDLLNANPMFDGLHVALALIANRYDEAADRIGELESDSAACVQRVGQWEVVAESRRVALERDDARIAALERVAAFVEDVITHRPCGSEWYADALKQLVTVNDAPNTASAKPVDWLRFKRCSVKVGQDPCRLPVVTERPDGTYRCTLHAEALT